MTTRDQDEPARHKARRYVVEGRVVVDEAGIGHVRATVRGEGALHVVRYRDDAWSCDCPAPDHARCSHLQAVSLVTAPRRST